MAVRPQNMHDGGIVERRLRPIYDWLDNGNNKKALQEAEKVLKKSPSLQAARALKALALFRLGKALESHAVLDALAEEKPSDDTTLQAMTITYRESQELHKVCALYEAAVKMEPTSEELHSHLFMSYVRVGDYRSQQRAAMALYKFAPKNPYYFWAVMSIVLQAKFSEDNTKKGILLALAQRMVDNFITENKMEAEQEARLYIMILELQDKWTDIIKFIESPLYAQLVPGNTGPALIPYLKKIGHWNRVNILCKELLLDSPDRWDYYLPYLDSVFELMKEGKETSDENVDDTPEKCHEFICQLVEGMTSGRTLRGPYLARLELWKRLSKDGDPTALLGSGVALCVQYLRVFAHKPCAVPDLRPYFIMLSVKEREEHCKDFLTCLGFDENSEPETTDDIQRQISCMTAWRLTAPSLSASESLTLAETLQRHYLRSVSRGLVTATLTEFCAADGYSVLAAHHYFYSAVQQSSSAPILQALELLELVLHNSPSNFHVKLLALTLYHLLGNALAADSVYCSLDVKHVQLLSLGWSHAARLPACCAAARALKLFADTQAFHNHHSKDSVDHLTYAYKYGTFEKLSELYSWRRRLEHCGYCAALAGERALLAMWAAAPLRPAPPANTLAAPTLTTDNRDLNVIVNFEPPQYQDVNLKSRTFEQENAYLRLKNDLVNAIALCTDLIENRPDEDKKSKHEQMKSYVTSFTSAIEKCKELYKDKEKINISAPFPSRIIAFVNSQVPYRELYSKSITMLAELAVSNISSCHSICKEVTQLVHQSIELLKRECTVVGDGIWTMRNVLESVSNYLEFIGVITYLLGVGHDQLASSNSKKSKKKTNQSPDEIQMNELLNTLSDSVLNSITYLENLFDNLPKYNLKSNLEEQFSKLNIKQKYHSPVEQKLKTGQQDMINDVKFILKNKSKQLKSLQ